MSIFKDLWLTISEHRECRWQKEGIADAKPESMMLTLSPDFRVEMLKHPDSHRHVGLISQTVYDVRWMVDVEQEEPFKLWTTAQRLAIR